MIRLLLQKQSDLGLHCLSRPFLKATSVRNFRTFTIDRCCEVHEILILIVHVQTPP